MPEVLSSAWFEQMNARFAAISSDVPAPPEDVCVVFEFTNEPTGGPHAMTFTVEAGRARLSAGDHLGANVIIRLSFEDGRALAEGSLHAGQALRDGRLKVRGDTDALNTCGAWIVAAQAESADNQ